MLRFLAKYWQKRLLRRMEGLLTVAQLAVAVTLTRDYRSLAEFSEEDQGVLTQKAAAGANYLFGKSPSSMHSHLDLAAEHAEARIWLMCNSLMCELVVQSLRVSNVIYGSSSGKAPQIGIDILAEFGGEFPESVDLVSYRNLILRVVSVMPPGTERQRLMAALG